MYIYSYTGGNYTIKCFQFFKSSLYEWILAALAFIYLHILFSNLSVFIVMKT